MTGKFKYKQNSDIYGLSSIFFIDNCLHQIIAYIVLRRCILTNYFFY